MAAPDNRTMPWTYVFDEPLRILVVDDDPILREFASVYLATPSATIETACDGVAARTRLGQADYDVLLLDIEMPQLNGLSLLEEIRSDERLKHLPVIMLTGHDDIASIDRAYQLGANSFATKPVNWRQLSYQIRYVIRTTPAEGRQVGVAGSAARAEIEFDTCDDRTRRPRVFSIRHSPRGRDRAAIVGQRSRSIFGTARGHPLFAQQALCRIFQERCSSAAGLRPIMRGSPSQLDAGIADQPLTDRKSVNAIELQS